MENDVPTIVLGDVDPDTPILRLQRIRPLADLIAKELGWDSRRVTVRIADSIEQMGMMLKDGRVDIYLDSVYPSLLVREISGSEIILLSLVDGESSYHSKLITRKDSPVATVEQFQGKPLLSRNFIQLLAICCRLSTCWKGD